jgi:hypothetical protein
MKFYLVRSPLANTIHLTDVNDLANRLVIVCRKAAEGVTAIAGTQAHPVLFVWTILTSVH